MPKIQPKTSNDKTLKVPAFTVPADAADSLVAYAAFIKSPISYVLIEAFKEFVKTDKEFKEWLKSEEAREALSIPTAEPKGKRKQAEKKGE